MFKSNRRRGLKQAIDEASDRELRELREELAKRQERVAGLEFELFETRGDLTRFERELDDRLGELKRQLQDIEMQLSEARRRAERRAQWGGRLETSDIPEDVVDQFRRRWRREEKTIPPQPKKQLDEATKEEFRGLYRCLAKRFHPDLATNPNEKQWRERKMAEVNEAYAEQDLRSLQSIAEESGWQPENLPITRDKIMCDLYSEIRRLDQVILSLEDQLNQLVHSATVKLMLDVRFARREGRDLLGEMAKDLMARIALVMSELSSL
jgi:hypothetical protein